MAKFCRIVTIVDLIRMYRDEEAKYLLEDAWSYLNRGDKDAMRYSWRTYETSFGSNSDPREKITDHSITKPSLHDIKTCNGTNVRMPMIITVILLACGYVYGKTIGLYQFPWVS